MKHLTQKIYLSSVMSAMAFATLFTACGGDGSSSGPSNALVPSSTSSVASEDDLPSCTESREGSVNFIDGTKEGFVCKNRKWVHYDMLADVEENLPGCTGPREGLSAYLYEEDRELKCLDGIWELTGGPAERSSSSALVTSSSSTLMNSSSSTPIEDLGSSSSIKDPGQVGEPAEGSSSSVASSSSAKSSSSVVSSSSIKYGSLTDVRDGQVYKTVTIGTQTWMAQNLNYAYTGVPFERVFDNGYYTSDSTSWCYDNKASNCDKYGRLYTWSAVMDSAAQFSENTGTKCGYLKTCTPNSPHRGICPEGWHVPTYKEYDTLYTYIGGLHTAGLLKSTSGWYGGGNGTDKYGFSVLPAGYRSYDGSFLNEGDYTYLWTATESYSITDSPETFYQQFKYDADHPSRYYYGKYFGSSLRCLKD